MLLCCTLSILSYFPLTSTKSFHCVTLPKSYILFFPGKQVLVRTRDCGKTTTTYSSKKKCIKLLIFNTVLLFLLYAVLKNQACNIYKYWSYNRNLRVGCSLYSHRFEVSIGDKPCGSCLLSKCEVVVDCLRGKGPSIKDVGTFLAVFDTPLPHVGILPLIYITSTF